MGGGAWSRRGPAEHRSAGSRRHGEPGPGRQLWRGGPCGGCAEDAGAQCSGDAPLTPTGSPGRAGAVSSAGRRAEGCGIARLAGGGSCSPLPTDPSSLSSSILSSSLSSLPPLRLLFCEWIRRRTVVRGTRQASDSPSPTPARGFAPVLPPRCSASGFLRVSWATAARIREPGLPSPFWHGGVGRAAGSEGKSPRCAHKFPFRCGWARQQGTPVSWRGCRLGRPAKFRG